MEDFIGDGYRSLMESDGASPILILKLILIFGK
jgi:hypothetical protein